jgi:hypothetical protein
LGDTEVTARFFPLEIKQEELAFGFEVKDAPSGHRRLLVAELGKGLHAVKARGHDGKTQYLVCDERLAPIYPAAKSLEELRTRFPFQ